MEVNSRKRGVVAVRHDEQESRFTLDTDDGLAVLGYVEAGEGTLDFHHTLVPEAARGRGVGGELVSGALEHARARGLKVIPSCPFVRDWLSKHDDQQDVVAPGTAR
ncbi:GNAT family N-acetyltransferase [soil metagenome]